jgi:hypothetical protein
MQAKPKAKTVAATAPVQQVKSGNGTPAAVKAKPAKAAAPAQELIPVLKSTALSLDVGPVVAKQFASAMADERQAKELAASTAVKRRDGLVITTQAIVKAAKAQKDFDLEDILSKSEQEKDACLARIWLALGFKHVIQVGEEGAQKPKMVWVPDVAQYVAPNKKTDGDSVVKQKNSVRSNMSTLVKKCAVAALQIVEKGIETKVVDGMLQISGPAVREQFGQTSVLLNENQTVQVKDKKGVATGETVKLKEKPSFQAIATRAAEAHGTVMASRVDSRKEIVADPEKEIVAMSKRYVTILEAIKKLNKELTAEVKAALESAYNAIDDLL